MRLTLPFLLACLFCSTVSATEQSALEFLSRMQTAVQKLNYHGTLVYLQDGQVQSMRIVHKIDEDGEYERIVNLNGELREVIRINDVVSCTLPDSQAVTVSRGQFSGDVLSKVAANDFGALRDLYQFELETLDRMAGLSAQRVLIKPRDQYRYGYRLWLDQKTGLLLKSDLLDTDQKVLEQAMFADVAIVNHIPQSMLQPMVSSEGFSRVEHAPMGDDQTPLDSSWKLGELPQGFAVSRRSRHGLLESKGEVEHWVVSDGLASVSIYIEQANNKAERFEGASQMGAINVFGMVMDDAQITVIGDVPADTVEMIARSMIYAPESPRD